MKSEQIVSGITNFINGKLTELSTQNPLMNIFRPVVARAVNNNLNKLDGVLKLIQDGNGNIDVDNILSEMIDNLLVSKIQKYPDILGGVTIGEGKVQIGLPLINKAIVLDTNDINEFKESLTKLASQNDYS